MKKDSAETQNLFRPFLTNISPKAWILAVLLFDIHALIRFGGLWIPYLIPLSMMFIWPLPWLLSDKEGRRELGFYSPTSWSWFINGSLLALGTLVFCTAFAWGIFGKSDENWLVQHAFMLKESLSSLPEGSSIETKFWFATIPAMIFSPVGEEFLFRGYIQKSFSDEWGAKSRPDRTSRYFFTCASCTLRIDTISTVTHICLDSIYVYNCTDIRLDRSKK